MSVCVQVIVKLRGFFVVFWGLGLGVLIFFFLPRVSLPLLLYEHGSTFSMSVIRCVAPVQC